MLKTIIKRIDERIHEFDMHRDHAFTMRMYSQVSGYDGIATGLTAAKRIILEEMNRTPNMQSDLETELANIKKVIKDYILARQEYTFLSNTSCGEKLDDAAEIYSEAMYDLDDAAR